MIEGKRLEMSEVMGSQVYPVQILTNLELDRITNIPTF